MNAGVVVRMVAIIAALAAWGCSKGNEGTPTITSSGKHPSGWAAAGAGGLHPAAYLAAPRQCLQCHGNDLRGGISGVSCFSASMAGLECHAGGPGAHPAGFTDPAAHGVRAKAAVGGVNGFASCQSCHGAAFAGGTTPAGTPSASCVACHGVQAPHPPKPWRGIRSHATVDPSNAAVCAQCHTRGANLAAPLLSTYATAAPGCFNSTLCHGVVGHGNDPRQPWSGADNHGRAAKGDPVAGDGMDLCRTCHGQSLRGNGNASDCFACHETAPHSPAPWRRTLARPTARTHTDTDPQNAIICAGCHQGNRRLTLPVAVTGTPSCFDNSLCHGTTGHAETGLFPVPSQPWEVSVNHGAKAKGSSTAGSSGFGYCRNCHGAGSAQDPLFQGGRALASCVNVLGCHGLLNDAPHPAAPWRGTTVTGSLGHTTTDTSNDAICAVCHTNGANSSRVPQAQDVLGATGCFNATLCHGITGHADTTVYPAPWSSAVNHGAFARTDPGAGGTNGFSYCQHCHGGDFSGGTANQSCFPCHGVSAPHPAKASWTPAAGALSHVHTGEGNASSCGGCHTALTKNLSTSPVNYQLRFAPAGSFSQAGLPGCYNGSLCHADIRKTSNCNVCHGPLSASVFNSLAGVTVTSDAMVGAHISHLNASGQAVPISADVSCTECHPVASAPGISGVHRDGTVTMAFGVLATTGTVSPSVTRDPVSGALQCANTYCHGATLSGGTNKAPRWNDATYLSGGCGLCHGFPPGTAIHAGVAATDCRTCHSHVNGSGTGFTDPGAHINGVIDATGGHSFPNPGSAHKSAANGTGCISGGCHSLGLAGSSYPVAAGTPPDCRACHLNANPTADPHCSDCHGSAANDGTINRGRPNGSLFPNRQGGDDGHDRGTHRVACTVCHPFTTGDARHGWSNRSKSASAQVLPGLNWNPGTRAANQGSCNPSAGGIGGCHELETGWY